MTIFRRAQSSTKTRCTSFSENLGFYTNTPILHQSVLKSVQQQKNRIIFSFTPPLRRYSFSGASVFSHSFYSPRRKLYQSTLSQLSKTINITAYDNEVLIGCLRILTDGYYFGTITELLVLPEYQKQGVGSKLLQLAKDNTPTMLYFGAQPGIEKFYEKNASDGISFHIIHPPLTRTKSASPLPVPKEFMADPQKVGFGIAKHIFSKRFIICHSFSQKFQTLICYLCPIKMGKLMSKMTVRYVNDKKG